MLKNSNSPQSTSFSSLQAMIYSGRGITLGMTQQGHSFIGYTLTGRSPSSQARQLVYDQTNAAIKTKVTDPKILNQGNPALLIYPAVAAINHLCLVASNGAQTKLLAKTAQKQTQLKPLEILSVAMDQPVFEDKIDLTSYEPDEPNFTPRICGCIKSNLGAFYLVKKENKQAVTSTFSFKLQPGEARTITTYQGDNQEPLKPFNQKPLVSKLYLNTAQDLVNELYAAINSPNHDFAVSAAVMLIHDQNFEVAIINKHNES